MSGTPQNWRRPLKNGDVQYFASTGRGSSVYGATYSPGDANAITKLFAERYKIKLPPVEWKKPLFK